MQSINDSLFENLKQHKISQLNKILGGAQTSARDGDCTGGLRQYDTTKDTLINDAQGYGVIIQDDGDFSECEPRRKEDTCSYKVATISRALYAGVAN